MFPAAPRMIRHWTGDYIIDLRPGRRLTEEEIEKTETALLGLTFDFEAMDREIGPQILRLYAALHPPGYREMEVFDGTAASASLRQRISNELARDARSGLLSILPEPRPVVRMARAPSKEKVLGPEPLPEEVPTFFEAAFVDELGEGIPGIDVVLSVAGEKHDLTTDGAGKVRVDGVFGSFGSVGVVDVQSVRDALKPRWDQVRDGDLFEPDENSTVVFLRDDNLGAFAITSETLFTVSIQPYVVLAQLLGAFFDTSKAFPLPSPSLLAAFRGVKRLYDEHPESKLLLVGHTDTAGRPSYNDPLSLERAEAIAAYLTDNVGEWLKWYELGVSEEKRWGTSEDLLMLRALPDNIDLFTSPSGPIERFQETRGLTVTGDVDQSTRTAIITDFMSLDDTTLPQGVELVEHGCGENFPEVPTADTTAEPENRRVEVFIFPPDLGVQPPPPGSNSATGTPEYPEWRKRARRTAAFLITARNKKLRLRMQANGEPLAGESYRLFVDDFLMGIGSTDADGLIDDLITSTSREAVIVLPDQDIERVVALGPVEDFPTPDTVLGAQVRLAQLGFYLGDINGRSDPVLDASVRAFKRRHGLSDDSQLDGATQAALVEVYGS